MRSKNKKSVLPVGSLQKFNIFGYNHDTVYHSKYFVNPSTGANTQTFTQTIECLWLILLNINLAKNAWYKLLHVL